MSKNVQIRDLDDKIYAVLRRRAAAEDLSLTQYLRRELGRLASQPTMAPMVMMPSIPRLIMPARSQSSSPRVAKIRGVAMRSVAAQKLACSKMSSTSLIAAADSG